MQVDNTNRGLDNSSYHAKTEFNNCFIIYLKSDANRIKATLFRLLTYLVLAGLNMSGNYQ